MAVGRRNPYDSDMLPMNRWSTFPVPHHRQQVKAIDMTEHIFEFKDPMDTATQLIFPIVPRGEERIEVQWVWIFGKPKYGKTTKGRAIINYALKSGRYDLSKTQIMEGDDLVSMLEKIKRGMELVICHINDAHKHQSTFQMATHLGREHADVTFLARHIFKNQTGMPFGVLLIIANAQEFKSINKWIRDQAVLIGYCGNIPEDENIGKMPHVLQNKLATITMFVEERKDQRFKSDMVVILPHRLQGKEHSNITLNDISQTPYGFVHLKPLMRACYDCNTTFEKFLIQCPSCSSTNIKEVLEIKDNGQAKLIPFDKFVIQVKPKEIAEKALEMMALREEVVDKLYEKTLELKLNPADKSYDNRVMYKAKEWLHDDLQLIQMFDKDPKLILHQVKGKWASERGVALKEDDNEVDEDIDVDKMMNTVTNPRYNPSMINILNQLIADGRIEDLRKAQIFKEYYFNKDGALITNPEDRALNKHELAQKYNLDRKDIEYIITRHEGKNSIWAKILYIVGHDYEAWLTNMLKTNNAMPLLKYDNLDRKILNCGGTGQPDVIVIGRRDGKTVIDIVSAKVVVFESHVTYNLNVSAGITSNIVPEMRVFKELTQEGVTEVQVIENGIKSNKRIRIGKDDKVNLTLIMRNTYYSEMEMAYMFDRIEDIPASITFSRNLFETDTTHRVSWKPI